MKAQKLSYLFSKIISKSGFLCLLQVQIFDLFAGEGRDKDGILGSPSIILKILNQSKTLIQNSNIEIKIILNEFDKDKFDLLEACTSEIADESIYSVIKYQDDFNVVFEKYYDSMKESANFLFLDQNGIKQITQEVLIKLINLTKTDFIFFISSSYIRRFTDLPEFKKYINMSSQDFADTPFYQAHRIVLSYYRNLIPPSKRYFLAPFSIKKPTGIYGLIFGTNHTYGIEKFLTVCWKYDKLTGEANFDIDNEKIDVLKPSLFESFNVPSKRQVFEKALETKILSGELKNNIAVYLFTLNEGFLPKDANIVLKKLAAQKKINYDFKTVSSKIHKEESQTIKVF